MTPPAKEIHFRNSGALLSNHPVTPPKPNKTANVTLPSGVENGRAYNRRSASGGQMINPRLKPSENAPASTPNRPNLAEAVACKSQPRLRFAFQITPMPMTIVIAPKTNDE